MSDRTFAIYKTETIVTRTILTEAQMREVFPNAEWDDEGASHAGYAEDQLISDQGEWDAGVAARYVPGLHKVEANIADLGVRLDRITNWSVEEQ